MRMRWIFCCAIVVAMVSGNVFGSVTYQSWTFSTAANPAAPEIDQNPYNDVNNPLTATITATGVYGVSPGWKPYYLGRYGVWHGELTTATLVIPNSQDTGPNTYKDIWLEMGYRTELVEDTVIVAYVPGLLVQKLEETQTPTLDGWNELYVHWRIRPNPQEETIFLSVKDNGADIDYINVRTECIPEPASLCLLGLGALVSVFARKRK